MAISKKIKFINYITINGERKSMNELSIEDKKEIAIKLNDKAMTAIGYVRVEETA